MWTAILFGHPEAHLGRCWSYFAPGSVFAYEVRDFRERGREICRLAVFRSTLPGRVCARFPGIEPGAEILFLIVGKGRTQRALREFDRVRGLGIDPADASPAWIRMLGVLLEANLQPRHYTEAQHLAHVALRKIEP